MLASTMDETAEGVVDAGIYVTLHIKDVPVDFASTFHDSLIHDLLIA